MKTLFLCMLCLLLSATLFGQDIILKSNTEEIKAKVLEVGETSVTYKKHSNLEGPSYTIPKSEIFMIKYQNGNKGVFKDKVPQSTQDEGDNQTNYEQQQLLRIEQQRIMR